MSCYIIPTEQLDYVFAVIKKVTNNKPHLYFSNDLYAHENNVDEHNAIYNIVKLELMRENFKSVNYSYILFDVMKDSDYTFKKYQLNPAHEYSLLICQAIQYMNDWNYQSSECKDFNQSLASHYANVIHKQLTDVLVNTFDYDLKWSIA